MEPAIFEAISKLTYIDYTKSVCLIEKEKSSLQIRNNKDLNFWLCCFSKTEHFLYPDLY